MGRTIKELREAKRLSQQDLATQLDVSVATVSRWERGLTEPYRRSLRDMARIFEVKPEEIDLEQGRRKDA